MKRASNNSANPIMKILFWLLVLAGATIVLFRLLSRLPDEIPMTPQTPISEIKSGIPKETATAVSPILFHEDFEDGKLQQIGYISDGWNIVSDETGNKVYENDNTKGSDFPRFYLGESNWTNYELKFRLRFLGGASHSAISSIIEFRCDTNCLDRYIVGITLNDISLNYANNSYGWAPITGKEKPLKQLTWYLISIQALESEIKISIDDEVVIFTDDTHYKSGHINIQTPQYTHLQIDDIQVIPLTK